MELWNPARVWSGAGEDPLLAAIYSVALLLFLRGGQCFRNWAVAERTGTPRFGRRTETALLWSLYGAIIAFLGFWLVQYALDWQLAG